jgi:hypothetical protein
MSDDVPTLAVPTLARELADAVLKAYHQRGAEGAQAAIVAVLEPVLTNAFEEVEKAEARRIKVESYLAEFALEVCRAAGLTGHAVSGEEIVARVRAIRGSGPN